MAVNLMRAGHAVRVFNRTAEKAVFLRDEGAEVVPTPKAAAEGADYVIAMVRDDRASREIWLHPTVGAAQGMHQGAIAIECSTLSPAWVKEMATYSQGRYRFLESPVFGTLPQAESRTLISLVGGDELTFRQAEAILSVNAKTIHYTGEMGSAAACKLVVNAQYSAQVAMLAESLQLAERYGLPAHEMVDLLSTLPTSSPALLAAGSLMAKHSFRPMFPIELVAKDLDYALQAARSAGVNAPLIEAVSRRYQEAVERGHGRENIVAISKLVEEESIRT